MSSRLSSFLVVFVYWRINNKNQNKFLQATRSPSKIISFCQLRFCDGLFQEFLITYGKQLGKVRWIMLTKLHYATWWIQVRYCYYYVLLLFESVYTIHTKFQPGSSGMWYLWSQVWSLLYIYVYIYCRCIKHFTLNTK